MSNQFITVNKIKPLKTNKILNALKHLPHKSFKIKSKFLLLEILYHNNNNKYFVTNKT